MRVHTRGKSKCGAYRERFLAHAVVVSHKFIPYNRGDLEMAFLQTTADPSADDAYEFLGAGGRGSSVRRPVAQV